MGDIKKAQADKNLAISSYQKSIKMFRKMEGNKIPEVPRILHKIGNIYVSLKDHDQGFKCYQEELEILGDSDQKEFGTCLLSMALIKIKQKDPSAKKLLLKARTAFENEDNCREKGDVDFNLGVLLEKENKLEAARDYFLGAVQSYPKKEKKSRSKAFKMAGSLLKKTGDPRRALEYYREALKTQQQLYDPPHFEIALTYYCIGLVHFKNEDYEDALGNFEESRDMCHALNENKLYIDNLNMIASIYEKQGNTDKAIEVFLSVIEMKDETI